MNRTIYSLALIGLLSPLGVATAQTEDDTGDDTGEDPPLLTISFIGNEAFMISDGETTLVTDFPYQSGYSIYMTYDPGYLEYGMEAGDDIVSLITHRHMDHFDPGLFRQTAWRVIGPAEVTRTLDPGYVVRLDEKIAYNDIEITPIRTDHSQTEHYSYLVEWHDKRLFFIGDTETTDSLYDLKIEVDFAFLTPWTLRPLLAENRDIPARQIIIYHHTATEQTPSCKTCLTPFQGQVIEVR